MTSTTLNPDTWLEERLRRALNGELKPRHASSPGYGLLIAVGISAVLWCTGLYLLAIQLHP